MVGGLSGSLVLSYLLEDSAAPAWLCFWRFVPGVFGNIIMVAGLVPISLPCRFGASNSNALRQYLSQNRGDGWRYHGKALQTTREGGAVSFHRGSFSKP